MFSVKLLYYDVLSSDTVPDVGPHRFAAARSSNSAGVTTLPRSTSVTIGSTSHIAIAVHIDIDVSAQLRPVPPSTSRSESPPSLLNEENAVFSGGAVAVDHSLPFGFYFIPLRYDRLPS